MVLNAQRVDIKLKISHNFTSVHRISCYQTVYGHGHDLLDLFEARDIATCTRIRTLGSKGLIKLTGNQQRGIYDILITMVALNKSKYGRTRVQA